jgi:hypothetical protein
VVMTMRNDDGHIDLPEQNSLSLLTALCRIEVADALGDTVLAAQHARWLRPYAKLPVMVSLAVSCVGSASYSLGVAERTLGTYDQATSYFADAVAASQRLGHHPMAAVAIGEWAETLTRAGEGAMARQKWADALNAASALSMHDRFDQWSTRSRDVMVRTSPQAGTMKRIASAWTVCAAGRSVSVPHSVGMGYLAMLVERPGMSVSAGTLAGSIVDSTNQSILDPVSVSRYRTRIVELENEIADAAHSGNVDRATRAQDEFDRVVAILKKAVRADGKSRRFTDSDERARSAVQKALARAVARIGEQDRVIGDQMRRSLTTGFDCCFTPVSGLPSTWTVIT